MSQSQGQQEPEAFTGRGRKRTTSPGVKLMDRVSRVVITVGGIGTIVAVLFILIFLIVTVVPLFEGADVEAVGSFEAVDASEILRLGIDDFRVASWEMTGGGEIIVRRLDSGAVIERHRPLEGHTVTAISLPAQSEDGSLLALGLEDGEALTGSIDFETTFYEPDAAEVPDEHRDLAEGATAVWDGGIVQRTPAGQLRLQKLKITLDKPIQLDSTEPVVSIDRAEKLKGPAFCALTADGRLHFREVRITKTVFGKVKRRVRGGTLEFELPAGREKPAHLVLSGGAADAYFLWPDGHAVRHGLREAGKAVRAEVRDLVPEPEGRLTAATAIIGKDTLIVGDDRGHVRAWSLANVERAGTPDGKVLVMGHELDVEAPVTTIAPSYRSRTIVVGTEDGRVRAYFVTSEKLLGEVAVHEGRPVDRVVVAPRDDGILAISGDRWERWTIDPKHPEASWRSIWGQMYYEGYAEPQYMWQTSGGSDSVEAKLSLAPLVFGTMKATLYSMLFAVPLALLAAIYTSEFLGPKVRPRIKSVVEVMASLPSVVLGFVAAFVLAPFVAGHVSAILLVFLTLPFAFILAANLWQLVPRTVTLGLERFRLAFLIGVLPIGIGLAFLLAPLAEGALFAGDVKGWLNGQKGTGTGGWVILLLPFTILLTAVAYTRILGRRVRGLSEAGAARFSLVRLGIITASSLLLAIGLGFLLTGVGVDPRGGPLGTFDQRNSLVVGFAMGFAVIPIIYTIAEDALGAVPEHLRAASLGAGATPWQTAVRVIVPTAASGLFSACMIGLGRAVGETMIVLMAAGNTPIMDVNIFTGFQTLSAAIATEMPEAVKDSTHYRVLFLAGLTLFAVTFVVNTVAEAVRIRFRKRAYQL